MLGAPAVVSFDLASFLKCKRLHKQLKSKKQSISGNTNSKNDY